MTAVSNSALTASQWNASLRDNILETAPAKATAGGRFFATTGANSIAERVPTSVTVNTSESTSSTAMANLTTGGPTVTVTTGLVAMHAIGCHLSNDTVGARSIAAMDVSGSTTVVADDNRSVAFDENVSTRMISASRVHLFTGLTAGSNTFKMVYRVGGGTGTFAARHGLVIPF